MRGVVAVIQPFMLEQVVDALRLVPNFPGMSVSEIRGFGRRCAHAPHRGERTEVEPFEERVRIEIFCRDAELKSILDTLSVSAHTGNSGDGKIFVLPLERAIRIRTREEGPEALLCGFPDEAPHG
ncbi:MAG: P-II family nitrogen regulator [Thermoanaerobaculia bacterium]